MVGSRRNDWGPVWSPHSEEDSPKHLKACARHTFCHGGVTGDFNACFGINSQHAICTNDHVCFKRDITALRVNLIINVIASGL